MADTLIRYIEAKPFNMVSVHPTVLLSIVDHYNRVAKDTKKRVVGILLGFYGDKGVLDGVRGSNVHDGLDAGMENGGFRRTDTLDIQVDASIARAGQNVRTLVANHRKRLGRRHCWNAWKEKGTTSLIFLRLPINFFPGRKNELVSYVGSGSHSLCTTYLFLLPPTLTSSSPRL